MANKKNEEEIIKYINNPTEESTQKIIEILCQMCKENSFGYCAFSGQELTDKPIQIDQHYVNPEALLTYYIKDGILDVSIGELKFKYNDGKAENLITKELTYEILQSIYGNNLNNLLKDAHKEFSKRLEKPVTFVCEQTGRLAVMSELTIVNGKKVCSEWVHYNKVQQNSERNYQNIGE